MGIKFNQLPANYLLDEEDDKYWGVADKAFKKALDLDPNFSIARTHIIDMLLFEQNFSEVIKEEIEEINRHPKSFNPYKNIITSYELLEDSTNAIKYFKNAK